MENQANIASRNGQEKILYNKAAWRQLVKRIFRGAFRAFTFVSCSDEGAGSEDKSHHIQRETRIKASSMRFGMHQKHLLAVKDAEIAAAKMLNGKLQSQLLSVNIESEQRGGKVAQRSFATKEGTEEQVTSKESKSPVKIRPLTEEIFLGRKSSGAVSLAEWLDKDVHYGYGEWLGKKLAKIDLITLQDLTSVSTDKIQEIFEYLRTKNVKERAIDNVREALAFFRSDLNAGKEVPKKGKASSPDNPSKRSHGRRDKVSFHNQNLLRTFVVDAQSMALPVEDDANDDKGDDDGDNDDDDSVANNSLTASLMDQSGINNEDLEDLLDKHMLPNGKLDKRNFHGALLEKRF